MCHLSIVLLNEKENYLVFFHETLNMERLYNIEELQEKKYAELLQIFKKLGLKSVRRLKVS